ncbi:phosphoinositide-specific phospholipase C [Myriangium duriaei CBS 260.36]|uniref:Phosphoinositide phospholipase C n=1 Tax=Myriangium duriaei CBS 260.36 TaxID=1168546 RepID=A0A9P4ITV3_9PEZI|nr:phosphoinositide-specific phospholipase C [Myriangium duriaei CBS 260.36]
MTDSVTSKLASLNPFASRFKPDDEDVGEQIDANTVAGGGHSARETNITKRQLRVSPAIRSFLVDKGLLSLSDIEEDSHALQEMLDRPHIRVPFELTDRSYSLPEYFISSSHNTYLIANQLYGSSAASAYETALRTGSRCIEIDAWDNKDNPEEPKVTHGYTLVSNIPFRAVCETIRDMVDREAEQQVDARAYRAGPILVSLENHCGAQGQLRLVQIMRQVFEDRLLSKAVRDKGTEEQHGGEPVKLSELGSKIALIVEYYFPDAEPPEDSSDEDDMKDEQHRQEREHNEQAKKNAGATVIIPELAELGVYAQSVKPRDNTWFEQAGELKDGPHHHLINVSESALSALLPAAAQQIGRHNSQHLMRVFPKGTRISSQNLDVIPFWGIGAQICALNWQTFGTPMQLNEALFSGTDGYVLKPAALRAGGSGKLSTGRKQRLRLHVGGATDLPVPEDKREDVKPYLTCTLIHPDTLDADKQEKRKTKPYKHHKLTGLLHKGDSSPSTDPIWDDMLEWDFEENELVFLRLLIKSDDSYARNPIYAVSAVRLLYVQPGWNFIRMLDLKGGETHCSLLVKFEIIDLAKA